jgi:type II secretory pathway component PulM
MSGLREALVKTLYEHEYADGGPAHECRCGAKLDTLSARALHWHQADAVLRVLAEHGGVTNLREQISLMVWRSANARAERAEADLAAARQQLDQVRALCHRQAGTTAIGARGTLSVADLLAILDAPARPAGHDETGQ